MSEFTPSAYQQKIYDWFRSGSDCIAVSAVAGSGKTTTIVQGLHQTPKSIHFNSTHYPLRGIQYLRNGMRNTPKWDRRREI